MAATGRPQEPPAASNAQPRHVRTAESVLLLACVALLAGFVRVADGTGSPAPDFATLDTVARKEAFFDYLRPLIDEVNADASRDREFVRIIAERRTQGGRLSRYERVRLDAIAARYEVELDPAAPDAAIATLSRRTGMVPASLIMIQAAKESGWGTSRFAREGRNLFGQRCYTAGCGIRPKEQSGSRNWGVARFGSIEDSLRSYVRNLNTHPEYREFRVRREEMRHADEPLSGIALAESLGGYSERGADYIAEIQAMIRQNDLE